MIVTRFAPSPTGLLHLGHAFAAITAYEAARRSGGRFRLRIEDLDPIRSRPEFEKSIEQDLIWLGLSWSEPVVRQSERCPAYRSAIERLEAEHLLYPCFCTRGEIAAEIAQAGEAPQGPGGAHYPGICRALSREQRALRIERGSPYALRLDSRQAQSRVGALRFWERGSGPKGETGEMAVNPLLFGDVVIARKDAPAAYHLAVVVDDAFQGVTLVTRGRDLFAATHVQRVLQALLDIPPPQYAHHGLIHDERGQKLSKRDSPESLQSLRERGTSPDGIRAMLCIHRAEKPCSY